MGGGGSLLPLRTEARELVAVEAVGCCWGIAFLTKFCRIVLAAMAAEDWEDCRAKSSELAVLASSAIEWGGNAAEAAAAAAPPGGDPNALLSAPPPPFGTRTPCG